LGRHVAPGSNFQQSLARSAVKGLAVVAVVALITVGLSQMGRNGGGPAVLLDDSQPPGPSAASTPTSLPLDDSRGPTAPPRPTFDPTRPSPTPAPTTPAPTTTAPTTTAPTTPQPATPPPTTPEPTATPATATPEPPAPSPSPPRVTVQIIDAGGGRQRTQAVRQVLTDLGYRIVASSRGLGNYAQTTVFYSVGQQEAALALQASDPRFAVVRENRRLDQRVQLHVVVGRDWR
jgi:hypothetical protein